MAFCPEKETAFNPVLDWVKHVVFDNVAEFTVERSSKFGGNVTYDAYPALEKDYAAGSLHPLDVKNALSEALIALLKPATKKFSSEKMRKVRSEVEALSSR